MRTRRRASAEETARESEDESRPSVTVREQINRDDFYRGESLVLTRE